MNLYKFNKQWHNQQLVGLFIASDEEIKSLQRHINDSYEFPIDIITDDFQLVTKEEDFINDFYSYFGLSVGYNPLEWIMDDD